MAEPAGVVLRGRFEPAQAKRYAHVPFEVPPGVRALHVRYEYSDQIPSDPLLSGGNTLDIGLFDPRGIAPSSPGFRGWSGSNKLAFSVTETWATPPYLSGPILPGAWNVLLGPYKVGPRGCEYRVEVLFGTDPGAAEPRPAVVSSTTRVPADLAAIAEPGWLRGDLHCHTLHSDGDSWPAEMLAEAVARGLDFLGVTDHNQVGHQADYARVRGQDLPIVLPGIEVTTYGGHWNAWGTDRWWEFREPETAAVTEAMQAAAASGALVSINHPKPYGPPWEYSGALGYEAVEVWNGAWERLNHIALAWWEQQLRTGRRLVALGGSDTHDLKAVDSDGRHGSGLGRPTTWARTGGDRTPEAVLGALRAGRVFVSRGPEGPQVYLERESGQVRVHVVGARGAALLLISTDGVQYSARIGSDDWFDTPRLADWRVYLRAQVMDEQGQVLALTNPLFAPE
ncbi:MAG: CehA/McbA family metallohydrolase [Chloroflexota bacterium]|nr:CehA/McbA family metallohydrolase [Chloroflexota bacterium]